MGVALSTLRTRARRRADQEGSLFCSDAEVTDYINEGAKRLHELVACAYGNEYVKATATGTTVAGTSAYNLPAGFFKLTGADLTINGKSLALKRFEEQERNAWKNLSTTSWLSIPRYKLENNTLVLYPTPTAAYPYAILYIPLLQVLVGGSGSTYVNEFTSANATDTISFPNGWEKFVTLYAAIEMMDKEESDTRQMKVKLAGWEQELVQIAADRDAGQPFSAIDVERSDQDPRWW